MPEKLIQVVDAEAVRVRVGKLAESVSEAYRGEPLLAVCVLKGAFLFFADLVRRLDLPVQVDFLRLSSYQDDSSPKTRPILVKDLDQDVRGLNVLLVDDIADTGRSLKYLQEVLQKRGPKTLKTCVLINKQERREVDLEVDFSGFDLEKGFLVGYGLDYAERHRSLDALYELVLEEDVQA
ncbi:MAG: hypoxanthine phosphoribosyltransferase [Desulfovibrionales bacterium]|nr:hypoxanthine phosphoribosyltransferase [Desulfovibrionales bacterium]